MSFRVLGEEDKDLILEFENKFLSQEIADETERTFASWKARWRPESLDHYLNSGWSVGIWGADGDSEKFSGYFLGQVFVFFQGHTQTLWIEHIKAETEEIERELLDVAKKYARDKHLQRVLLPDMRTL